MSARGGKRAAALATGTTGGARRGTKKATMKRASGGAVAKRANGAPVPTRLMRIRELDPRAVCGSGTTVMQLFRVDDLPVGTDTTHLVFLDRHGWYCQHGRECPAVSAVRRHEK